MDYTAVTEVPGNRVTHEALAMLHTRYAYAADLCAGKRVLEVACGAGQGLGYLAGTAAQVVAGDYTANLVALAQRQYRGRVSLLRLDAQALPFKAGCFQVVLLYEALYYIGQPERFLQECRRSLEPGGVVLICMDNKERRDFIPSPFSRRYYSAKELMALLEACRFHAELYGAFPIARRSVKYLVLTALKRLAVALDLVPKTMKGKEFLKRIFLGALVPLPAELLPADGCRTLPVAIGPDRAPHYRVIYAVAHAA